MCPTKDRDLLSTVPFPPHLSFLISKGEVGFNKRFSHSVPQRAVGNVYGITVGQISRPLCCFSKADKTPSVLWILLSLPLTD